jgi:hypothetical protein
MVQEFGVMKPDTPTLQAITLTNANTEYHAHLPAGCRKFAFRCRSLYDVRFAFATDLVHDSTDPYQTLPAGRSYVSPDVALGSATEVTVYFASATAGVVMEVEAWV